VLTIDAPRDARCRSHTDHEWTVRFHLKRGQQLLSIAPSAVSVTAATALLLPSSGITDSSAGSALAGCGAGQRPAPGAGPVVEIRVRQGVVPRGRVELRVGF
jgi:hypothetical protein